MHSEVRMMNRLQLSQSSTHDSPPLREQRESLPGNYWEDVKFFRSWLVYDFNIRPGLELPRVNWKAALGLALATAVSASIWAGIILVVARVWR
jgi:hypothetical protein